MNSLPSLFEAPLIQARWCDPKDFTFQGLSQPERHPSGQGEIRPVHVRGDELRCERTKLAFCVRLPGLRRRWDKYDAQQALENVWALLDANNAEGYAFRQFAWFSPYLVGSLTIDGADDRQFERAVFRLRIIEALLEALVERPAFEPAYRLLLRQRFRLLAELGRHASKARAANQQQIVSELVPLLQTQVRQAQRAWHAELTTRPAETELLLRDAKLDAETEARALLLAPDNHLWPFCAGAPQDVWFTDTVLRSWFLPHYDLPTTAAVVRQLVKGRLAPFYHPRLGWPSLLAVIGGFAVALLMVVWCAQPAGTPEWVRWLIGGVTALAWLLGLAPLAAAFLAAPQTRTALYPYILRLPAGVLVGLVTLTGLVDKLTTYAFTALDKLVPSIVMAAIAVALAGIYLWAEARSRLVNHADARRRALGIWGYGIAVSVLLTTGVSAFFAGPAGLTDPAADGAAGVSLAARARQMMFWPEMGIIVSPDYVLLGSCLALAVGVLLQILWEDKAISEPM